MAGVNRAGPARQSSLARLKRQLSAGRLAATGRRKPPLQRYASVRKFGRRHELERERRQQVAGTAVEFSRRNPDEEDTVMEAQWRIREALAREKGLARRFASLVNRMLGFGNTTSNAPTVILDHVLLGSGENAADRELLCSSGVTHICNCAVELENHYEGEFVYMKLHIRDAKDEELIPLFQSVTAFLRHTEEIRGRALIHCIAGASRSPALLIAYLMIDKKMPLLKAYSLVRNQRRVVRPNQSFRLQLAKYELMLFGGSSVATTHDPDWNFFEWNEAKAQLQGHAT